MSLLQDYKTYFFAAKLHSSQFLNLDTLVAQTVKNLPAMWKIWVHSLGLEDPLEKGTETHSSIPAWSIPWAEEPGGL